MTPHRRPCPLLATVLLAGSASAACSSPRAAAPSLSAPVVVSRSAAPTPPPPMPPAPVAAPVTWPEPDRGLPPWSQTQVAPIAVGAVQKERAEKGVHLRVGTEGGVVHAWRPGGYSHRTAGTVIYLHGYFTDVDQAWSDHRLADQFRRSGRNALFLAVEAPSWNGEEPFWPTLDALLGAMKKVANLEIPRGPLVVAGHSGAFRGIIPWLVDPRITEVLLLDGLYQDERSWSDWLDGAPRGTRRLVLVGLETAARSEAWLPTRRGAVFLPRVPEPRRGLKAAEQNASVLYMRSQHDHMALIEKGEVLPLLLRSGRLATRAVGRP